MGKNDKDTSSYMNNRIPRKKTASSTLITNSGNKSTGIQIDNASTNEKQSAVTSDILSVPIPRQGKDGMQPNIKKRTHDMSSVATTTTKTKAPKKAKLNNNENTSTTRNDTDISPPEQVPIYQIVKEGRVSGYPIIVSQVGSEHDAILLGCKDNPQDYLNKNKDGKVKIRWKFAGYNGLVPTNTIRLKVMDFNPPIRKAAVLSGLLETGDELVANKVDGIDLGEEEDDDAPILKAIKTDLLDSKIRPDKDGDYNDQEDRDEKLICYERSASVGYVGGKTGLAANPTDNGTGISLPTNQDEVGGGLGADEVNASIDQGSDNAAESSLTFEPQINKADTDSNKPTPPAVDADEEIDMNTTNVDSNIVDAFFEKLISLENEGDHTRASRDQLLEETKEMIIKYPSLVNVKGQAAVDYFRNPNCWNCIILYELVLLGAKATDESYSNCFEGWYWGTVVDSSGAGLDHIIILLLSGYFPPEKYFLDDLVETMHYVDDDLFIDIMRILGKRIKLGYPFKPRYWGDILITETLLDNIKQLPTLTVGVTHSKDGSMDKLMQRLRSKGGAVDKLIKSLLQSEADQGSDIADTNSHKPSPSVVTSQSGIKTEDGDADSVATDPMVHEEVVPMEVKSDINVKTEGEETDDDEVKPSAVTSDINVKLEGEDTDDELELQPVASSNGVKNEAEAAYECDTDNDEPKPLEVTSDMNLKTEEVDTDNEMDAQQVELVTSSNDVKKGMDSAYGDDTDDDEPKPLEVKSDMNVKAEEEDTDDEMNTSSLNHDNPTIFASTSEEDKTVVLGFFQLLNSCLQVYSLDSIKEMIKLHPSLLNATCPSDIGDIQEGFTAMEAVCQQETCPDTRDLLYDLVLLGGKATDKCYEVLHCDFGMPVDHLTVLLLSGYYPTKGHYLFLDELAEGFENDDGGLEPVEMLSILYKTVKLGDLLSCGNVDSTVIINNINQLPPLETGVTHSKGGPMEKLLYRLPAEKVQVDKEESLDDSDSSSGDEEIKLTIAGVDIEKVKKKVKSIVKSSNTELTVKGIRKQLEEWLNCDLSNDRDAVRKIVMEADLITEQEKQLERKEQDEREQKKKKKKKDEKSPSTTTRTCSVCEMIKDRDDFSKTQWKKGDDAKCKDCIAIKQGPEAQKKLAAERSLLDKQINKKDGSILDEQVTVSEKGGVTDEGFSLDKQASNVATENGANISAPDPSPKSHYEKVEIMEYKQKKARYDEHAKKLEESGRSIDEEMKSSTDLVYVVTSIQRGGDPFSPQLHGIYTTCKRAQDSARKAFSKVSRSYRKGKFLPDEDRIAKCDTSEYLIPGIEYTSRIMFELFGDFENDDYNAVAVTAIKIDVDVNVDLPFIDRRGMRECKSGVSERKDNFKPGTKVYAIFSHHSGSGWDFDVNLAGVYTKREDAFERGLKVVSFDDEEIKKEQIGLASGVSNGRLFHDNEDGGWAVAMETVTLNVDVNHNRELELGVYGDGCWMCPRVEFLI